MLEPRAVIPLSKPALDARPARHDACFFMIPYMRIILLALTFTLLSGLAARDASANDSRLRVPANGAQAVPLDAQLWFDETSTRLLRSAVLRDGANAEVAFELMRDPLGGVYRVVPATRLAPNTSYTLTLQFTGITTPETISFRTGTELTAVLTGGTFEVYFNARSIGGGGPNACPAGTAYFAYVVGKPVAGAALYSFEYSEDRVRYAVVAYQTDPTFTMLYLRAKGYYRLRPISLANSSPPDAEIESLLLTPPPTRIPPCDNGPRPFDDEEDGGCSASGGSARGGLAGLMLTALARRRRRRA